MVLPDGVDGELVINAIAEQCCDLELLYPDGDFMQYAIGVWSAAEYPTWERVYNLSIASYNPLENYDRMEDYAENESRKRDTDKTDSINSTSAGASVSNSDDTTRVAGYNSDSLGMQNKVTGTGNTSVSNTGESTQKTTEGVTDSAVHSHKSRIHGNIGVTTPAQMMQGELDIAPQINVINYIVNSFKNRFCLLVY